MASATRSSVHPFLTLPNDVLTYTVKQLFQTDLFGICIRTPDLRYFDANDAFLDLIGYPRSEAQQLSWMDIKHPDELGYERDMLLRIARGEIPGYRRVKRYVRKDGTTTWADVVMTCTFDQDGRIEYFISFVRKVHSRHQRIHSTEDDRLNVTRSLITALRSQNSRLQDFAQIVSHNVRLPVGNMRELLKCYQASNDEEDRSDLINQMQSIVDGLTESIDVLTRTIRVHQGIGIVYDQCPMQVVYDRVVATLGREIQNAGATLSYDFSSCPEIKFPESYLESILHNLISNAIKYRDASRLPQIAVTTHVINGVPVMQVADNGRGIDLKRHSSKLFGLWQTFHDNIDSRGIGLYMTRLMLESLGGIINCVSEVGKGSVFSVQFAVPPLENDV